MIEIKAFMQQQVKNSAAKGFERPSTPEQIHRSLLLVVGEIIEAQEELRAGHSETQVYLNDKDPNKPEGFAVELADALIRILHIAGDLEDRFPGFDFTKVVMEKFAYNATRPFKHGKKF